MRSTARVVASIATVLMGGMAALPAVGAAPITPAPTLTEVRMVAGTTHSMAYDPVRITVHQGDTARFIQTGNLPHNVVFRSVPKEVDADSAAGTVPQFARAGLGSCDRQAIHPGEVRLHLHAARGPGDGGHPLRAVAPNDRPRRTRRR